MTAILPRPSLNYTEKDFASIKLRLESLIRSVFPDWTDFSTANFGNILTELFCHVGDVLTFYQDAQARESFWPTLVQRVSAIRQGRLFNFSLTTAASATASETFTTVGGAAAITIPIPEGTRVRSADPLRPLRYRTTAVGEISVGNSSVSIAIEQAVLAAGESFDSNDGPNQEYVTEQSPYIDDTAIVTAIDGTYLEVDSFLDDDPLTGGAISASSRIFRVIVDQLDRAHIQFGDGVVGKIPQGTINISYKVGGGSEGNVEAGVIRVIEDNIVDELGDPVTLTATNPAAASGGIDRMSVAEARTLAPSSLRALIRSVTKDDFEVNARQVPGVSRAVMVTSNEDSAVQENTGRLQIVARGEKYDSRRTAPATPSSTLLTTVETMVTTTKPQTLTFVVYVDAAPFKTIDVSTRVYLERGTVPATVGEAIRDAIKDLFASELEDGSPNPDIDFGANILDSTGAVVAEIAWSDVFNAVRDTDGVRKVDEGSSGLLLNLYRQSISLEPREFPIVGTISVIDADSGSSI